MHTAVVIRTDEELLAGYKSGSVNDFRELVERYRQPLFRYLFRLLADVHTAEDLFQEVFLNVHRSLHTFKQGKPVKPWLYAIATNLARDEMHRRQVSAKTALDSLHTAEHSILKFAVADSTPSAGDAVLSDEKKALVRAAVDTLSDTLKPVLVLFHYEGLKYREIAETLDIPIGTVKSRLHAALMALAKEFEKNILNDEVWEQ